MKLSSKVLIMILVLVGGLASAQVATSTPAFGSFGGGPFDVVNLGNLNVHFSVPILHKAGRGTPFAYDLTYDSSIWTPVTSSGTTQWQPDSNWGWGGTSESAIGYALLSWKTSTCDVLSGNGHTTKESYTIYTTSGYVDRYGTLHPVKVVTSSDPNENCVLDISSASAGTTDGSGYVVSVSNYVSVTVTSRSGRVIKPSISRGIGTSATHTDANGNQITENTSGQFFDTLSSTVPVLTVTSPAPPSSTTFTYAPPTNEGSLCNPISQCVSYSMNYTQYTVRTGFGVSNASGAISEYGPLSNSLVSGITLPDGTHYTFTYEKTPGSCTPISGTYSTNCVTGRIASVSLPTGGSITYTYSGGTSNTGIYSDGSTAGLTRVLSPATSCSSGGCWQYARSLLTGTPGTGSTWKTTVTDPSSASTVINFAEDDSSTLATYNLYETQRVVSDSTGTLLTTLTCYNTNTTGCATAQVSSPIYQTDVTLEYPNSGQQSKTETKYNGSGLVTDVSQYAYGASAPGGLLQHTAITYASLTNNIYDRPASVIVDDGTNTLSKTTYAYDETAYPVQTTTSTPQHNNPANGSRGNATTITNYSTSSASLARHFQYYDTGTLYKTWDVNGSTTSYAYGTLASSCGNSFPTSVTLPITGLTTSMTWDCTGGVALTSTDANTNSTLTNYNDPDYWRPTYIKDQLHNTTNFTYTPFASGNPASVEGSMVFNTNSITEHLSTLDGLGRISLSQQQQGNGSSNYDTTQINYDSVGRPYQVTMPFVGTASQTGTAPVTTTSYDGLGRVTKTLDAGSGYVSYVYTQNDVLQISGPQVTGENLKQKQLEYDALGRLISVCEVTAGTTKAPAGACGQKTALPSSATAYLTTYAYSVKTIGTTLYTQVLVTQNAQPGSSGQQTRTYIYDLLGRLFSETNPEGGTTQYFWDAAPSACGGYSMPGDLGAKEDNALVYTCYGYDPIHRLIGWGNPGSTNCTGFIYDSRTPPTGVTVQNSKGHLVEAYTNNTCNGHSGLLTDEWFSYSVRGELTDVYESTPHSGSTYYHVAAGFWANGALNTLSSNVTGIPSQTFSADGEGRPSSVIAGSGQNPVNSTSYDLVNYKTTVTFGSLDSDVFTLDSNTGRLKKYQFNIGTSQSDTGTLTWNPNGSLNTLAISNTVTGTSDTQSCAYSHDDMARIASVNCGNSTWRQNFSYDAFGNINKDSTGYTGITFNPLYSTTTNQFTSLGTVTPTYDADGRLTYDGVNHYTWDAQSKMATITGTTTASMTYDAFGRMVEKAVGTAYTQIVYSPLGAKYAVMSGTTLQQGFIPLPTGAKAIYTSTGLTYYRHHDHLGSSRLATTPNRTLYSSTAYAPFGEPYASTGTTDLSFTGQDQDTTSGMHDFMDRRYMPVQGRWLTPDPAGLAAADPANPQTWNRYAYVANNPLAMIDPFGDQCYDVNTNAVVDCNGSADGTFFSNGEAIVSSVTVNAVVDPVPSLQTDPLFDVTTQMPGSGGLSDPTGGYLTNYSFTSVNNIPTVSQWHPPKPTDVVKAPYKPLPYKPSVGECLTNPGNAVELMAEAQGQEAGPGDVHDPAFPLQIYHNGTTMGSQSINTEEGEAKANGAVVVGGWLSHLVGCMTAAIFGN